MKIEIGWKLTFVIVVLIIGLVIVCVAGGHLSDVTLLNTFHFVMPTTTLSPNLGIPSQSKIDSFKININESSAGNIVESSPESTVESLMCDGYNWESCWRIDDDARSITWIGSTDGSGDIGEAGVAKQDIINGYIAIVVLDKAMTISICSGTIDGVKPSGVCSKTVLLSPGRHVIVSPGKSGGFRIY